MEPGLCYIRRAISVSRILTLDYSVVKGVAAREETNFSFTHNF